MPSGYSKNGINRGQFKKGMKQTQEAIAKRTATFKNIPRTKEWCDRISESHKGEKNPAYGLLGVNSRKWIADRTLLKKTDHRANTANWEWKRLCKERDESKCRIADENCNGGLEIHHILSYKDHPELRYQVNNGITLCRFHHPLKKELVDKLSPYFQELVNETQL